MNQSVASYVRRRAELTPATDKVSAVAARRFDYSFDADQVDVHSAAGGFDAVMQMSTARCLEVFDLDLKLDRRRTAVTGARVSAFLAMQAQPFASQLLRDLASRGPLPACEVEMNFVPESLTFSDPRTVRIAYRATLTLYVGPSDRGRSVAVSALAFTLAQAASQIILQNSEAAHPYEGVAARVRPTQTTPAEVAAHALDLRPRYEGQLSFVITGPYEAHQHKDNAQSGMVLDTRKAAVQFNYPDADVERVYTEFFGRADGAVPRIVTPTLSPYVCVTPYFSLVGAGHYVTLHEPVSAYFDAVAFHVNQTYSQLGAQSAAVVGMSVIPNRSGDPLNTQHFIGNHDYGVIWNGEALPVLFHHSWKSAGFMKQFDEEAVVRLVVEGVEQDVRLTGTTTLTTLETVKLVSDSNMRTDYLAIGGRCRVRPLSILLADGRRFSAPAVDLGPAVERDWGVLTFLDETEEYSTNPSIRAFQIAAEAGTYQYIGKPFTHLPSRASASTLYVRTEAATQHVFALGRLAEVFP